MIDLKDLTEEYLASFPLELEKEDDIDDDNGFNFEEEIKESKETSQNKALAQKVKKGELTSDDLEKFSEREKALLVLTKVFTNGERIQRELKREEEPVLDRYSWYDLSLIRGNAATPDRCLLNTVKRTKTAAGSAVMASQLINPHTDIQEIEKKQEITEALEINEKAKEALTKEMDRVAENESTRLSLWKEKNALQQREYQKELDTFDFKRFGLESNNTSKWMLQLSKFWKDFTLHLGISNTPFMWCYMYLLTYFGTFSQGIMYDNTLLNWVLFRDTIFPGMGFFFCKYSYEEEFSGV